MAFEVRDPSADIICGGITSKFCKKRKKKKGKPGRVSSFVSAGRRETPIAFPREALAELLRSIQLVSDSTSKTVAVVAFCLSSMMDDNGPQL